MHRALDVAEIRRMITAAASRGTNVQLAQVSRGFLGLALDEIWRILERLDPLLNVVPNPYISGQPTDWDSFNTYVQRVQKLHLITFPSIPPSTIALLLKRAKESTIFPRLRELSVRRVTSSSHIRLLHLFVSPFIRSLAITHDGEIAHQVGALSAFLADLCRKAPALEKLELDIPGGVALESKMLKLLEQTPSLKSIVLGLQCQTDEVLARLAQLPALETLKLPGDLAKRRPNWRLQLPAQADGTRHFPKLRLLGVSHKLVPGFAQHVSPAVFRSLLVTHRDPLEALGVVAGLPASLPHFPSLPFISPQLSLALTSVFLDVQQPVFLHGQASVAPLIGCMKLRRLVLHGWATLGNEVIHPGWGRSWPELETLLCHPAGPEDSYRYIYGQQYHPTLASVGILSRSCPELKQLDIPVHASHYSFDPHDFAPLPLLQNLSTENWWLCRNDDGTSVELVLRAIAPSPSGKQAEN